MSFMFWTLFGSASWAGLFRGVDLDEGPFEWRKKM